MILMRGKDITRDILFIFYFVLGPEITRARTLPMAQVMYLPRIKIIRAKRHIKKQVQWYFYANEKRVVSTFRALTPTMGRKGQQWGVK